jgi:hypothetical protein
MRHAGPTALSLLDDLIAALRALPELRERKHGVFYRKAQAFAHFHEDPAGLFADVRAGADFTRYPVNTPREKQDFMAAVHAALGQ